MLAALQPNKTGLSLLLLLLLLSLLTCPPVAVAPGCALQWWARCQTQNCGTCQHSSTKDEEQAGEQYSMMLLLLVVMVV
jgi:hypothetical protein